MLSVEDKQRRNSLMDYKDGRSYKGLRAGELMEILKNLDPDTEITMVSEEEPTTWSPVIDVFTTPYVDTTKLCLYRPK